MGRYHGLMVRINFGHQLAVFRIPSASLLLVARPHLLVRLAILHAHGLNYCADKAKDALRLTRRSFFLPPFLPKLESEAALAADAAAAVESEFASTEPSAT